jgi:hypothetical protein
MFSLSRSTLFQQQEKRYPVASKPFPFANKSSSQASDAADDESK